MNSAGLRGALLLLVLVSAFAFVSNWIWEMAQMPAYSEMAERPWKSTAARCTIATAGDVGITLSVYLLIALASGKLAWAKERRWNTYAAAALLGFFHATLTERWALASGAWSYREQMIRVPILDVGLWPFLQLGLLVPISIWCAALISRRAT